MTTIPLNRQFIEWSKKDAPDLDVQIRFGLPDGLLEWETLLKKRRVVILAEAGSGKTEEMQEQTRLRKKTGKFAFYAAVKDVGQEGLSNALSAADCPQLETWRMSDEEAWFFIDSVDEAKFKDIRLEKAIRHIAKGIVGGERRAHIILSGRLTDWEFRRDIESFKTGLPIPDDIDSLPLIDPDKMLINVIRNECSKKKKPEIEQPLIVLMASLDQERVRLFASAKGMPNVDKFLTQIEEGNLWRFARRPLDLDWLVQFWQSQGRLGSLTEMIESSLTKRLCETNSDRAIKDGLDNTRALHALERIGAALVLGQKSTIAIPDSDISFSTSDSSLDLVDVLPDWSAEDRKLLITRPVFDPATFGRARLHNDNEGVVRGYLTARWLCRLRKANLSRQVLFDLLFANTYGHDLIKPSMCETVAWLALWDEDIAREVVRRDPDLLLSAGDPAILPVDIRQSALICIIEQVVSKDYQLRGWDLDSLKRFARPDIVGTVRALWSKYSGHKEARALLLRIIRVGSLKECADLVVDVAFNKDSERLTNITAGLALIATGDDKIKRRYVDFIKVNCANIPNLIVWNAIDGLFPDFLSVDDLLVILAAVDIADSDGGPGFAWQSPDLVKRLNSAPDMERLLKGLLEQVGGEIIDFSGIPGDREDTYFPAIAATAYRLLEQCSKNDAPLLTINAALRIGNHSRRGRPLRKLNNIGTELHLTSARRRIVFWYAAEYLGSYYTKQYNRFIDAPFQMSIYGYSPELCVPDLEWLLIDGPKRTIESERRLAVNAAMQIWKDAGSQDLVLSRIKEVAMSDTIMAATYEAWINPPPPPPELTENKRELEEIRRSSEVKQAEHAQSWLDFVADIRNDPEKIGALKKTNVGEVNNNLYHLWLLLNQSKGSPNLYAIDSVASLEPMLGRELTEAIRDGLIQHWRSWKPTLKSTREKRNEISLFDCMGIVGVTLEAKQNDYWVEHLTPDEVTLAASYATLELNGLPWWASNLAIAKPIEMRAILMGEIIAELNESESKSRYDAIEDLSYADEILLTLVAPALLQELIRRPNFPLAALRSALNIIFRGLQENKEQFIALALSRFNDMTDIAISALYLGAVFGFDPVTATNALKCKLDTLEITGQKTLAEQLLPLVFGGSFFTRNVEPYDIPFDILECLVSIAFSTIRVEDDHNHSSGEVYSPNIRDDAQRARDAAFTQLIGIPGRATYDAINRLKNNQDCPIPAYRLEELGRNRAAQDSESAPWMPGDLSAFEQHHETAPRTAS